MQRDVTIKVVFHGLDGAIGVNTITEYVQDAVRTMAGGFHPQSDLFNNAAIKNAEATYDFSIRRNEGCSTYVKEPTNPGEVEKSTLNGTSSIAELIKVKSEDIKSIRKKNKTDVFTAQCIARRRALERAIEACVDVRDLKIVIKGVLDAISVEPLSRG